MKTHRLCQLFMAYGLLLLANTACGEDNERALARAQQMLQQLSAERARTQTELAQVQAEYANYRSETERQLASTGKKLAQLEAAVATLRATRQSQGEQIEQTNHELDKSREYVALLEHNLEIQTDNFSICKASNDELADTAFELIRIYRDKDFADVLLKREPVTGLAKVRVENIVQQYEDRVLDNDLQTNLYKLEALDPAAGVSAGDPPYAESSTTQ